MTAPEELRSKLKYGLLWNTGISLFRDVLQFGVMLVMVRLLDPKAYGQFGLVNSFMSVFTLLSIRPFLEHSLQPRPHEKVDYQLYFTAGAFVQPLLFVGFNLLALVLQRFHDYAEVVPLLRVASIIFLLDALFALRSRMLERALDWQRLRLLQGIGLIAGALLGLGLALGGLGAYALVAPMLMEALPFIYDLLWIQHWRPTWHWNAKAFIPARRYGLSRIAAGLLTTGRALLEGTVLVHMVGYASFGIYGRATGIAALACMRLPVVLLQTIYPVLTKIEAGTDAYRKANRLILRAIIWTVIPLAALLSLLAGPVVRTLYGTKWLAAIPLLPWALAAGSAGAMMQAVTQLLLANCQQARCIASEVTLTVGTATALWLLLPRGTVTYLAGITVAQSVCLILSLFWLYKGKAITVLALWHAFGPTLIASALALGASALVRSWLPLLRDLFLTQIGLSVVFALVCALALRILFAGPLKELIDTIPFGPAMQKLLYY